MLLDPLSKALGPKLAAASLCYVYYYYDVTQTADTLHMYDNVVRET